MAKTIKEEDVVTSKPMTVLHLTKRDGWMCIDEYEIPDAILKKYGKVVSKSDPDIWRVISTKLESRARELYEI